IAPAKAEEDSKEAATPTPDPDSSEAIPALHQPKSPTVEEVERTEAGNDGSAFIAKGDSALPASTEYYEEQVENSDDVTATEGGYTDEVGSYDEGSIGSGGDEYDGDSTGNVVYDGDEKHIKEDHKDENKDGKKEYVEEYVEEYAKRYTDGIY
ncbi:hypothetical protein BGX38DRAFT_1170073, partial [Terfezia claveryi]